jgi:vanillate O-demethylase monooxygenase subunit
MGEFLKNAWYVAAWGDEVTDKPLGRKLLDRPIVFYRKQDGSAVAMDDRCPHRFVQLSGGEVRGDEIMCPYHGLTFDPTGRCTHKRANDVAKERFTLRTYPLVERYRAMWIWMGDPALADPDLIPVFRFFDEPGRIIAGRGTTYVKANYTLEIDNLLDLSHLDFVHARTISNGCVNDGQYRVYQEGNTVHSDWFIPATRAPVQFQGLIQLSDDPRWEGSKAEMTVDHWLDMRWDAPGTLYLDVGVAPADTKRDARIDMAQAHFVTPETELSTHYFWIYSMTDVGQSEESLDHFLKVVHIAFDEEDRPMLEAQQAAMAGADFWAEQPMILAEDAGAVRARRVLDKLIREENRADASRAGEESVATVMQSAG